MARARRRVKHLIISPAGRSEVRLSLRELLQIHFVALRPQMADYVLA